jgi:hypothetical protein
MMAGFREFAAGEPLTATNVDDFLMKQSVMKFADGAARDLALGTAVASGNALREGMVAYLDDTDEVIKYDGSAWASVSSAGIGSNVVQTVKTDTFSASIGGGGIGSAITGMSVSITPTSDTSRILVMVHASINPDGIFSLTLYRDGNPTTFIGDADGSRRRVTTAIGMTGGKISGGGSFFVVDSPATTSSVTYTLVPTNSAGSSQTIFLNRGNDDTNNSEGQRAMSSITAIEVAA